MGVYPKRTEPERLLPSTMPTVNVKLRFAAPKVCFSGWWNAARCLDGWLSYCDWGSEEAQDSAGRQELAQYQAAFDRDVWELEQTQRLVHDARRRYYRYTEGGIRVFDFALMEGALLAAAA